MESSVTKITAISQKAYAICIIGMGIKQLAYGHFDPNYVPFTLSSNIVYRLLAYPWGIAYTLSGIFFLINKKAFEVALISSGAFLVLLVFVQIPSILLSPDRSSLIMWSSVINTSAFVGSSLIMAASIGNNSYSSSIVLSRLEKLIPYGAIFYSIMFIVYGIDHFLYIDGVSKMVPDWIPYHYFWTYFAGIALIGAGVAIILKIKVKLVAILLGIMLFLWFLLIHIQRAIADPYVRMGMEVNRVFITFGFTGISFLLAFTPKKIER
jgi:uncharacterized membrane protein YphA (DoxX/SURF4 family)